MCAFRAFVRAYRAAGARTSAERAAPRDRRASATPMREYADRLCGRRERLTFANCERVGWAGGVTRGVSMIAREPRTVGLALEALRRAAI